MQGTRVDGKYEIVKLLGQGGMGAVYEARHVGTGRRVAVKVIVKELITGKDVVARFQREARASGSIDSQHVVQVLDSGIDSATSNPYMVMEFMAGEDLRQLIDRVGPVSPDLALRLIAQSCLGLAKAHDVGILHRDIKSANLYIARREGAERIVKILDFGIAKILADEYSQSGEHGLTRTGSMMGSPLYMSPEQALGLKDLDSRSDLWSLGVVLYELLGGTAPHARCETLGQLLVAIASKPIEAIQDRAPWVPIEVAAIVHKSLAHDRAHRFQSAVEMYNAICALLPQGVAIHDAMLGPVSQELRARIAHRPVAPTPVPSSPAPVPHQQPITSPGAFSVVAAATPALNVTTGAGVSSPHLGEAVANSTVGSNTSAQRPRALFWALPAALVTLGLVGGGAYYGLRGSLHFSRASSAGLGPSSTRTETSADQVVGNTPSEDRTSQVVVSPAEAQITVDGSPATAQGDRVDVHGPIGSVHTIKLRVGSHEDVFTIAISDAGAVPPRIALEPTLPTSSASARTAAPPQHAVGSQRPGAGHPAGSVPPATPATPKPVPAAPTVDRSM